MFRLVGWNYAYLIVLCYNFSHKFCIGYANVNLDTANHSVFLLYYHLVLVVKCRRSVFDDTLSDFARDIFVSIANVYNITLKQWDHDKGSYSCNVSRSPKY